MPTVENGDSYFRLAEKIYGDQRMAFKLMAANNNRVLIPGMSINTPQKEDNPYISQDMMNSVQNSAQSATDYNVVKKPTVAEISSIADAGPAPEDILRASQNKTQAVASSAPTVATFNFPQQTTTAKNVSFNSTQSINPLTGPAPEDIKRANPATNVPVQSTKAQSVNPMTAPQYAAGMGGVQPTVKGGFGSAVVQTPTANSQVPTNPMDGGQSGSGFMEYYAASRKQLINNANTFQNSVKEYASTGSRSSLPRTIDLQSLSSFFSNIKDAQAYLETLGYKSLGAGKYVRLDYLASASASGSGYSSNGSYSGGYGFTRYSSGGGSGYYSQTGRSVSLYPLINWRIK